MTDQLKHLVGFVVIDKNATNSQDCNNFIDSCIPKNYYKNQLIEVIQTKINLKFIPNRTHGCPYNIWNNFYH